MQKSPSFGKHCITHKHHLPLVNTAFNKTAKVQKSPFTGKHCANCTNGTQKVYIPLVTTVLTVHMDHKKVTCYWCGKYCVTNCQQKTFCFRGVFSQHLKKKKKNAQKVLAILLEARHRRKL